MRKRSSRIRSAMGGSGSGIEFFLVGSERFRDERSRRRKGDRNFRYDPSVDCVTSRSKSYRPLREKRDASRQGGKRSNGPLGVRSGVTEKDQSPARIQPFDDPNGRAIRAGVLIAAPGISSPWAFREC